MNDSIPSPARMLLALAVALGCGLLVGVERERRKGHGPNRALGGIRSFALASLAGALCMLLGSLLLVIVGAAFTGALGVVSHARERSRDPGVTTEIALLLTFLTGALSAVHAPLAAGLAVVLTAVLGARQPMHRFASDWLRPAELRDGIVLAAFALIALPMAPDRPLWGKVLNPHLTIELLVLLLAIQGLGHMAGRLMSARRASVLAALAAGFASSTAAIASLGVDVRDGRRSARAAAGGAQLSCVATMLQLLMVIATVRPAWLHHFWLPALAGSLAAAVAGGLTLRYAPLDAGDRATDRDTGDYSFISLRDAALVAAAVTGLQVLVQSLTLVLGNSGLVAGTLLAALLDVHSAVAALLAQAPSEPDTAPLILLILTIAIAVHSANKLVVGAVAGGRAYALALLPGLLAQVLVFACVLVLAA